MIKSSFFIKQFHKLGIVLRKRKSVELLFCLAFFIGQVVLIWPLPDRLAVLASLELVSEEGIAMGEFREVQSGSYREKIPLKQIPTDFVDQILLAEDQRFYYTPGFDPLAFMRALYDNISHQKIVSGSSGICMQLVKILYKDHLPESIWLRKPLEIFYAIKLSFYNSDQRILNAYVNTVPMPLNRSGMGSAAMVLFGRNLKNISPEEMACLVMLIRQNRVSQRILQIRMQRFFKRYNLHHSPKLDPQKIVYITSHITKIRNEPIKNIKIQNQTPHFLIYIKRKFPDLQGRVPTTIQDNLQLKIHEIIKNEFHLLENKGAEDAAVVVLENMAFQNPNKQKLALRALVGSRNFYQTQTGQINGALIKRNAGSSLKPFVYALAFEKLDLHPFDIVEDSELTMTLGDGSTYRPRNYDLAFWGKMTMREALATSRNIPAVTLANRIEIPQLYALFKTAGFDFEHRPEHYGPALALGSGGARLLKSAYAYSLFTNKGHLYPLIFLQSDRESSSNQKAIYSINRKVLEPSSVYYINSILSDRIARRRSFGSRNFLDFPFQVAAKTGTSKDYRDSWTIGYTDRYIVGAWVGRFSGGPMDGVAGSSGAGRIFHSTMRLLHTTSEYQIQNSIFDPPAGWKKIKVCSITGRNAASLCPANEEWVPGSYQDSQLCPRHQSLKDRQSRQDESEHESPSTPEPGFKQNNQNNQTIDSSPKILSPVSEEVYLLDPHTPRFVQHIPIEISLPGAAHESPYFYRIDAGKWIPIHTSYNHTIQAKPGKHTIELKDATRIINTIHFYVE